MSSAGYFIAYAVGAMGFLAFKGWGDAKAGQATNVFGAIAASLFWPVVWPIMAGQLSGAAQRRKDPTP